MPVTTTTLNALATELSTLITHIGLLDTGVELTGGTPAYARQAVTWTSPTNGVIQLDSDLTFDVPSGSDVTEWRGYSASSGGTDYGGGALVTETYASQGEYTLLAASTGIAVDETE